MTPDTFASTFGASHRQMDQLRRYEAMLRDWQPRMNLVGPATLDQVWLRHFADSAQLVRLTPSGKHWLDIGAGAGFPGLVLALLGHGRITLVDSVAKKTRFLEAVRIDLALEESATVLCARAETLPTLGVDVVTARAAAPLAALFDWGIRHVRPGGMLAFPKGRRWADEVSDAQARFSFDLETFPSMTEPEARIIVARGLKRR